MTLLARFEATDESAERRGSERRELRLAITAASSDSPELAATIHDLSESGFLLETAAPLAPGHVFQVFLPLAGAVEATVVWNTEHFYGCQFRERVAKAAVSAALLKSVPKAGEASPETGQDLASQLRDVNARIERIGEDLDRAIEGLSNVQAKPRPADPDAVIAAALPRSAIPLPPEPEIASESKPERFYEPLPATEGDAAYWVVVVSLVLAGLAALILIAALLGSSFAI